MNLESELTAEQIAHLTDKQVEQLLQIDLEIEICGAILKSCRNMLPRPRLLATQVAHQCLRLLTETRQKFVASLKPSGVSPNA